MIKVDHEKYKDKDLKTIIDEWGDGRTKLVLEPDEYNAFRRACWEYVISNNNEEEIYAFVSFVEELELFENDYCDTQVEDYDICKGYADELLIYKCPLLENTYYGVRCADGCYISDYTSDFIKVAKKPITRMEWFEVNE